MNLTVINKPLRLTIYGFSGTAVGKDYAGTAIRLMDKMWSIVKSNNLKNKGLNVWVYEPNELVFAGVELDEPPHRNTGLEQKVMVLTHYAYYKHIGPYHQIKQAGENMRKELAKRNLAIGHPYIEVYGHWIHDESRLETELIMCLG